MEFGAMLPPLGAKVSPLRLASCQAGDSRLGNAAKQQEGSGCTNF